MNCYALYYVRWQANLNGNTDRSGVNSKNLAAVQIKAKLLMILKRMQLKIRLSRLI